MAKTRVAETGRERVPPPPRMTGLGLQQAALIAALGAIIFAGLGGFMAGNQKDPNLQKNVDAIGVGLVTALTAAESETWRTKAGTYAEMRRVIKELYGAEFEFPAVTKETKDRMLRRDAQLQERNQNRLQRLANKNITLTDGMLRGLKLDFTSGKLGKDQHVGAQFNPKNVNGWTPVSGDVSVGTTQGSTVGGGPFRARVYSKPYKNAAGSKVGTAFAVLNQSAIDEAGASGGMWVLLTPLLVAGCCILIILQATQAAAGARSLARDLDTIGRGRLDLRVTQSAGGEVGLAQRQADRMTKNLQLIMTTGSGDLDEALEKELDLATQIHESLRPNDPPRVPGFELETLFKGGREIGGDYFDYIDVDETRVAIVIADCSESMSGVAAAMVMAMTRAYLKTSIDADALPSEWLKMTNRRLANDLKSGMAVTALIAVLDTSSGEVTMASAGHRPVILWRAGKTATINPNGIALGLDIGPVFDKTIEDKKITMQKNDRLVIYTDGAISAKNNAGEAYGDDRFMASIQKQGAMNSAAFVNFVAGGVDKFLGGEEQDDDITISTLKRMK
ncbi:MAG: PP2C family protein-serine/threonine phosphatase [Planctomycetota bacterium]